MTENMTSAIFLTVAVMGALNDFPSPPLYRRAWVAERND
jgi:hypothetical protein